MCILSVLLYGSQVYITMCNSSAKQADFEIQLKKTPKTSIQKEGPQIQLH